MDHANIIQSVSSKLIRELEWSLEWVHFVLIAVVSNKGITSERGRLG